MNRLSLFKWSVWHG